MRRFKLINGKGSSFDLNGRAAFFHSIEGFGFRDETQYEHIGTDFYALDEVFSQWMDALRAGRTKQLIPDRLVPRDPETGEYISPNPFDNRFIVVGDSMQEGKANGIQTDTPEIPSDSYLAAYITALDVYLQGVISPSTIGIDVKKLDNAEARIREATIRTLADKYPDYADSVQVYKLSEYLPVYAVRMTKTVKPAEE